jgi:hypothetical protein
MLAILSASITIVDIIVIVTVLGANGAKWRVRCAIADNTAHSAGKIYAC